MKAQTIKRKLFLILLCCLAHFSHAQTQNSTCAAQWHFAANDNSISGGGKDWVISMIATDKKEYICAGYSDSSNRFKPVIFKLDNLGKLVWIKKITSAGGNGFTATNKGGLFWQVIKGRSGKYAAVGYTNDNTTGQRVALLIEIDDNGNITPASSLPQLWNAPSCSSYKPRTIAMDPSQRYYVVAAVNETTHYIDVMKIDCVTNTDTHASFGNSVLLNDPKKIIARDNGSGGFDIYICGAKTGAGGRTTVSSTDLSGTPYNVNIDDADIWLLKLSSSLSTVYDVTYNKSNMTSSGSLSYLYTETGPASARSYNPSTHKIAGSLAAGLYGEDMSGTTSQHNVNELAYDMIFNKSGSITMVAMVNIFSDFNAIANPFLDNSRGSTVSYTEYKDGDAFLMELDPANGALVQDAVNVAHFSGGDFFPHVVQNIWGNYIIAGSTADNYASSNPNFPTALHYGNAFIVSTDGSTSGDQWRRSFIAKASSTSDADDAMCIFALDNTADGGFVIGGNNGNNHDDFTVTKFAPPVMNSVIYSSTQVTKFGKSVLPVVYSLKTNETWPSLTVPDNSIIASKVVVPAGKTLTINTCGLIFVSSDHLWDYYNFPPASGATGVSVGIVVEPGGHLVLNNAELTGVYVYDAYSNLQRFMWDGIVVHGNPSAAQNATNQGTLNMTNYSIIYNARYGAIFADNYRTYTRFPQSSGGYTGSNISSRYNGYGTMGGGILYASNSTFYNCRFGINFQKYDFSKFSKSGAIDSCTFTSDADGMGDVCFYADPSGGRLPANTHVAAWAINNLRIQDNTFTCATNFPVQERPTGIASADAQMTIAGVCLTPTTFPCSSFSPGNTFTNLQTGIAGSYTPGNNAHSLLISRNTFDNNLTGVNISGSTHGLNIGSNNFFIPGNTGETYPNSTSLFCPIGVNIAGCDGYSIGYNTFDKCSACSGIPYLSVGLNVNQGHTHDNLVDHNTFNNLRQSSVATALNGGTAGTLKTGLRFHCNDYLANPNWDIVANSYVINKFGFLLVSPATMDPEQGNCATSPAGNRFYNVCAGGSHLSADGYVTQAITYNNNQAGSAFDPGTCHTSQYTNIACGTAPVTYGQACGNGIIIVPKNDPPTGPYHYDVTSDNIVMGIGAVSTLNNTINTTSTQNPAYSGLVAELNSMINDWTLYYNVNDYPDSAAMFLETYKRFGDAFPFYMKAQMYTDASRMIDSLPLNNGDDSLYAYMAGLALSKYSSSQSWYDLDSTTMDSLNKIPQFNSMSGYLAGGISYFTGNGDIDWPHITDGGQQKQSNVPNNVFNNAPSASGQLSLYPNPVSNSFTVTASETGALLIYTLESQLVKEYRITEGKNDFHFPQNIANGLYIGKYLSEDKQHSHIVRIVYQR